MIRIGLDIGSTTLKCVILNASGELLYKDYRRHFSRIAENAAAMLGEIAAAFPNERECEIVVSGSAGMGIAETLGLPFVQEVYATRTAVRHYLPDCDVVIELGGEDAKILFLGEDAEVRMNGSCAGGTGA
ncbi:MAG: BadF/BadG/BcrA/BcrD ATPase family protein, partial [Acutalibacteraceae bacterium]